MTTIAFDIEVAGFPWGEVDEITQDYLLKKARDEQQREEMPERMALYPGMGKIIAPMAFVYAPVLLFVSSTGFNFIEFSYAATSCILGVVALSAAVVGYFLAPMSIPERVLAAFAGLVAIAPTWQSDLFALALVAPIILMQVISKRRALAAS